jgi:hypothetical protein
MLQPKLLSVEPYENYTLLLSYETGEIKLFDVKPYITGDWYSELFSTEYFNTVHTIRDGKGIEWGNGQDIAPHELYELSVLQLTNV